MSPLVAVGLAVAFRLAAGDVPASGAVLAAVGVPAPDAALAAGDVPASAAAPAAAGAPGAAGGSVPPGDHPNAAELTRVARLPSVEDAYKQVHQAYLGPGHAIPSKRAAATALREEWAGMDGSRPDEVLLESLLEGAPFVRVHLRPYRDMGGELDSLLAAFLRGASVRADTIAFLRAWRGLRTVAAAGRAAFTLSAYDSLDALVRAHGFPAVHHSRSYSLLHAPAYRVLPRGEAKRLLRALPDRGHRH